MNVGHLNWVSYWGLFCWECLLQSHQNLPWKASENCQRLFSKLHTWHKSVKLTVNRAHHSIATLYSSFDQDIYHTEFFSCLRQKILRKFQLTYFTKLILFFIYFKTWKAFTKITAISDIDFGQLWKLLWPKQSAFHIKK